MFFVAVAVDRSQNKYFAIEELIHSTKTEIFLIVIIFLVTFGIASIASIASIARYGFGDDNNPDNSIDNQILSDKNAHENVWKEDLYVAALLTAFTVLNSSLIMNAINISPKSILLGSISMYFTVIITLFLPILLPAKPLIKRLTFVLVGVALIFGLSEASKLVEHISTALPQIK
jgi:hypothetical protein